MGVGSWGGGMSVLTSSTIIRASKTIGRNSGSSEPEKPKKDKKGFWKWLKSLFKR